MTPLGDGALRLDLPPDVDRRATLAVLRALPGVADAWLTEQHACVRFDTPEPPDGLPAALFAGGERVAGPLRVVRVRYDGPDLPRVAQLSGLSVAEVIALHTGRAYDVRFLGFLPGFAYFGDVDPRIAVPRLPTPRTRVPPHAVAIAGTRACVYPFACPGGWNLLGTALDFSPFRPDLGVALQVGDRVRFESA